MGGFIDHFGSPDNLTVVDPVMGDNGSLYSTMNPAIVGEMRRLIGKADIITPNFTEAALLLNEPYREPVSYTHLDVYKRQVRHSAAAPDSSRLMNLLMVTATDCRNPVSYTHLDVYKRQALLS